MRALGCVALWQASCTTDLRYGRKDRMRRTEGEIAERVEMDSIIRRCPVCRLGLSDHGQPYVVPLCFGYDGKALYFHCAGKGRKLDILLANNRVCITFDIFEGILEADQACNWGAGYQSVMGFGTAHVVSDEAEKQSALHLIMAQYANRAFTFPPDRVRHTTVVRVDFDRLTGKQSRRV